MQPKIKQDLMMTAPCRVSLSSAGAGHALPGGDGGLGVAGPGADGRALHVSMTQTTARRGFRTRSWCRSSVSIVSCSGRRSVILCFRQFYTIVVGGSSGGGETREKC